MDTLQGLITSLADRGNKPFLLQLEKEGRREYTYRDLVLAVRQLANGLAASGIKPGDYVGLLARPGFQAMAASLGILQAGAAVMPLDLQIDRRALAHILKDSQAVAVFSTADQRERLEAIKPAQTSIYVMDADSSDSLSWKQLFREEDVTLPDIIPEARAALFYTSGTTGPAKGVPLSHGNLAFQINTVLETGLAQKHDRVLLPLPLHHVYPFVIGMFVPLALGLTLVLPYSLTGPQMIRALNEGDITIIIGVPRLYDALYAGIAGRFQSGRITRIVFNHMISLLIFLKRRAGVSPSRVLFAPLHRRFGPSLRILASGGAPLDPDLAWKLVAMGWEVAIGYGLTETSPLLTIKLPGDLHLESVGRPVEGVDIRINPAAGLGSSNQQRELHDLPRMVPQGEIQARGPNVFHGYLNLPEETRDVFTDDGWFRTGDLGHLDRQGYLHVAGRISTLIIMPGGENVQPDEIEETLSAHPFIREAGVLQKGDGRLAAVVVPEMRELRKQDTSIHEAVQQAVSRQSKALASYKRITDAAVSHAPLPRTRLGKIRRHLLPDVYRQAKEETKRPEKAGPLPVDEMSEADRTLLENPSAKAVWDWLAQRYADARLTPDTSPELDLGVDSLEWVNITMEIQQRTGVELEEESIPDIAVVRDLLAKVAEKTEAGETGSLASPLEEPEQALSGYQQRWLAPRRPAEEAAARALFYLNQVAMRLVFRLQVTGSEYVPREGPFIIAPNHVSYLDPFAVGAALDFDRLRQVYWAGWTGVAFRNPLFRFFSRLAQVVPIDPRKGVVSSLAFGAAVLKRNQGLVWFPEGHRSPTGVLQPFKPGIGLLLERYPVPVIPAFIFGTEKILPRGRAIPRIGTIAVVFSRPLDVAELTNGNERKDRKKLISSALHDRVAAMGATGREGS